MCIHCKNQHTQQKNSHTIHLPIDKGTGLVLSRSWGGSCSGLQVAGYVDHVQFFLASFAVASRASILLFEYEGLQLDLKLVVL